MKTKSQFKTSLVLLVLLLTMTSCTYTSKPTTIFIVRHADRLGAQDALNPLGFERAGELKRVLENADIEAIYVSQYNRTHQTADSLAIALNLAKIQYDAGNIHALADSINKNHFGKTILVVGHSNTVSQTIAALDTIPNFATIPEDQYDNMYIVTRHSKTGNKVTKLKYGAKTPL